MAIVNITIDTEKNSIKLDADGKSIKNVREINVRMCDPPEIGWSDDMDGDEVVHVNIYCREKGDTFDSTQILTLSKAGVNIVEDSPEQRFIDQVKRWRNKK